MDLTVATRDEQGGTVVLVAGEIDVYTAPRLREELVALIDGGRHRIVVDMQGVEFLDSTGLGVLVGALKRVRGYDDGALGLVCHDERILKIFRITGLTKVFAIHPSVATAMTSLDEPAVDA